MVHLDQLRVANIGSRHLVWILLADSKVLSGHDDAMAILDYKKQKDNGL